MTRLVLGILAWVLSAASASAGPAFSGEDAAYIDWGAKNCATKSTDKEHTIVDEANAKDSAGFLRKYQGKDLSDQIKGWYGPGGSRIAGMITWENTSTTTAAADKPASKSEGRRGRRRQPQ
jgi:hypothetical protein